MTDDQSTLNPYLQKLADKEIRRIQSWRRAALWLLGLSALGILVAILVGELGRYLTLAAEGLRNLVVAHHWPGWIPETLILITPPVLLLGVMLGSTAVLVWWERKVAAHTQIRLGPMETGGWHGWAQVVADGIKLF